MKTRTACHIAVAVVVRCRVGIAHRIRLRLAHAGRRCPTLPGLCIALREVRVRGNKGSKLDKDNKIKIGNHSPVAIGHIASAKQARRST